MATTTDGSRLIVKNLPLTLDNKTLRKIFTENASKLGLQITDCQLLHKYPNLRSKHTSISNKGAKVFENGKVSKGVCFIGFINQKFAKKFKEYYNGTYVRSCKITVDFARPPTESIEVDNSTKDNIKGNMKAGVASIRTRKIFNEEGEDEVVQSDIIGPSGSVTLDGNNDLNIQKSFNRVVLFNLPYNVSEDELRKLVKNFGPITQIHIPASKFTESDNNKVMNLTRGFAYITFLFDVDAGRFLQEKDKTIFCGRLLSILPAKVNITGAIDDISNDRISIKKRDTCKRGYKAELKERLMEDAENQDIWNTLYIDINTAIQAVSDELGISRDQLLRTSDKHSVAVTAASSETAVIAKLKNWLNEEGVDIDCFQRSQLKHFKSHNNLNGDDDSSKLRSCDTIIVKNLSFKTDEDELRDLFAKKGQLMRFSISPYRNMCIVQYLNAEDAKKAFTGLAYKNYLGMPIYLEWAPCHLYKKHAPTIDNLNTQTSNYEEEEPNCYEDDSNDMVDGLHASIYIKNLNFITNNEKLHQLMSGCDGLITCKVITRYDSVKDKTLSMGFGFAEFVTLDAAKAAIKLLTGKLLDGHLLEFSLADKTHSVKKSVKRTRARGKIGTCKVSNKLSIKNLAFQATKSEVRKLFSLYGNVRTVRIPKSMSNSNRGFAFVEFESKSDAVNALEALQHTHLYGRHLILDFAQPTQFDQDCQETNSTTNIVDKAKHNM